MSAFRSALARHRHDTRGRRWLFVPYDQLTSAFGPLAREPVRELGIVVVENPGKAARRPYHRQKLATVLANLRHFALEQAARGVAVRHVVAPEPSYASAIAPLARELGPLRVMRPAERELRTDLAPLVASGVLEEIPHEGWLTTRDDFDASQAEPPWRMDAFYKYVRKKTGLLMNPRSKKPLGGRFSFDAENRKRWNGAPPAPDPPTFTPDDVTREVFDLVERHFERHPGVARPELCAATHADAERLWDWAKSSCLPTFGPFEDAMSTRSRGLFHTRISPLVNLSRLSAARVVLEAADLASAPLASREGFVRQMLGWREYMHHVHEATDGFRVLPGRATPEVLASPGDGGYARWRGSPWVPAGAEPSGDGGSLASHLGADGGVPPAYWGAPSGLNCVDQVIASVWDEGWSHHITRLMVLSNFAMLLDVSPRELTDWFWVAYVDAYDWVVEPNVHAMGTFGVGDLATTKPYIAGAAYIDKMSDFCGPCRFDPKTTCPYTPMYWAYLERHRDALAKVPRMKLPLLSESRRADAQRASARAVFERVRAALLAGEELAPEREKQRGLFSDA